MTRRLISGRSDSGICLLFGQTTRVRGGARESVFAEWLKEEIDRGAIFRCDLSAVDGCAVDCYVHDEPPEDIDVYALQKTEKFLLKIPSGRLCFATADAVAEDDTDAWDCLEIPAADYAVRAWLVHPPHLPRTNRRQLKQYGIGSAILLGFIIFGVFGINQITAFVATVALGVMLFAAVASMTIRRVTGYAEKQRQDVESRLRNGPPDLVVRLTVADDPHRMTGGGISIQRPELGSERR